MTKKLYEMSIPEVIYDSRERYVDTAKDAAKYLYRGTVLLILVLTLPIIFPVWAYLLRRESRKELAEYRKELAEYRKDQR